jgi:hypothetical protein
MIKEELLSYETNEKLTNEINAVIKLMYTEPVELEKSRKEFYNFVNEQDRIRNQSFISTFPELKGFYEICKNA